MTGLQKGILILICVVFIVFSVNRGFVAMNRIQRERIALLREEEPLSAPPQRSTAIEKTGGLTRHKSPFQKAPRPVITPVVPVIRCDLKQIMELLAANRLNEAMRLLNEIRDTAASVSDQALLLYLAGEISFRSGDGIGAAAYYLRLIEEYPNHPAIPNAEAALEFLTKRRG